MKKILNTLFYPVLVLVFNLCRWIISSHFEWERNKKFKYKLNYFSIPFIYIFEYCRLILNNICNPIYINYGLNKYSRYISDHYKENGIAYEIYNELDENESINKFNTSNSAIEYYIYNYKYLIDYKDGESFFEPGCGLGNNLHTLNKLYPESKLKGFDLSQDAINFIKKATKNNNIDVECRDVLNLNYLSRINENAYDHTIMSHVFSLLISNSNELTDKLRLSIIRELIRISKKSFILIDNKRLFTESKPYLKIEQKYRCMYYSSLYSIFNEFRGIGEFYIMHSDIDASIIFKKT